MGILMADIRPRVSILEPDRFEINMQIGDIYKNKMHQKALKPYWSAFVIKKNESYIHRSVLEIYKTLFDLEIKNLKKLEGQSSFTQKH